MKQNINQMNQFDPSIMVSEEYLQQQRRYLKNQHEAKRYGCKIEDPVLYESSREKNVSKEVFEVFILIAVYTFLGFPIGIAVMSKHYGLVHL